MSVTAPPRPPRPSDPVTHGEFDALVEALIEEARQRAQRRRRRNAAAVTLVALVGVALFAMLGRSAQSETASPALSMRTSLAAGAASSKIAFISEPPSGGYCGVVYAMNADGSEQRRLTNGGVPGCGQEGGPAWSPDGRIAIVGNINSTHDIYVMNADGSGQRRLTRTTDPVGSPAWSPDGRKIAFARDRDARVTVYKPEIHVINADGSAQRRLTQRGSTPLWSPDGRKIAFVSSDGIHLMNADGSGQRLLTRTAVRYPAQLAWSPDGRKIAFVSNWQVWVMNADGSGQRRLTRTNRARNVAPAWSPNGRRIAFERQVGRQKYENTALEYGQCSRCDGWVSRHVYVMNADGSDARKLAQHSAHPVWSPDGRKIAFAKHRHWNHFWRQFPHSRPGWESDIYVMNADGSGQRNLTRGAGRRESQPLWSPAQKK